MPSDDPARAHRVAAERAKPYGAPSQAHARLRALAFKCIEIHLDTTAHLRMGLVITVVEIDRSLELQSGRRRRFLDSDQYW